VCIEGSPPVYFSDLQIAYASASEGDTLQSQALHFNGNPSFGSNVSVKLQGGYDGLYVNSPSSTTINGTLTIYGGTVIMENIVIR